MSQVYQDLVYVLQGPNVSRLLRERDREKENREQRGKDRMQSWRERLILELF